MQHNKSVSTYVSTYHIPVVEVASTEYDFLNGLIMAFSLLHVVLLADTAGGSFSLSCISVSVSSSSFSSTLVDAILSIILSSFLASNSSWGSPCTVL